MELSQELAHHVLQDATLLVAHLPITPHPRCILCWRLLTTWLLAKVVV